MRIPFLILTAFSLSSQAFSANVALGGTATQDGTRGGVPSTASGGNEARFAIDGNRDGVFNNGSVTHTTGAANTWWEVNVGNGSNIWLDTINIWNRTDCCTARLGNFELSVLNTAGSPVYSQSFTAADWNLFRPTESIPLPVGLTGEVVRIERTGVSAFGDNPLSLAEVEIFGNANGPNAARLGTATQSSTRGGSPSTASGGNDAGFAIDGIANPFFFDQNAVTHTGTPGPNEWWEVALPSASGIHEVSIVNRLDNTQNRLQDVRFDVYSGSNIVYSTTADINGAIYFDQAFPHVIGDRLRITTLNNQHLHVAQVFVYVPEPSRAVLLALGLAGALLIRRR